MSHALGTICTTHGWVMENDVDCPERGCLGGHGYTLEPCRDPCPASPGGWLEDAPDRQRAWLDQVRALRDEDDE